MTEEFLHFIWKNRLFPADLRLTSGEELLVLEPGERNGDGGPDFFNARVRIGNTVWIGNVEIHVDAEDWYRHRHHQDRAYDNVVLHVVSIPSVMVSDRNGQPVPTLVIDGSHPEGLYDRYLEMKVNRRWIACKPLIATVDGFILEQWSAALCIERMAERTNRFRQILEFCGYNWEEAFFVLLCRSFGFRVNTLPFELLGKAVPVQLMEKHRANLFQLEAILFGQAGFLDREFRDEYPRQLAREYDFLRRKYQFSPLNASMWKFLRMRPSNFPTVRIAQLAGLLHRSDDLFTRFLSFESTAEVRELFAVKASDYWDDHFLFEKVSAHRHKLLGPSSILLLVVNFVVPFLFFYGEEKGLPQYKEKGLDILEGLPSEASNEMSTWKELGIQSRNAMHSQALLQLKSKYCDRKRCLECRIGKQLLSK